MNMIGKIKENPVVTIAIVCSIIIPMTVGITSWFYNKKIKKLEAIVKKYNIAYGTKISQSLPKTRAIPSPRSTSKTTEIPKVTKPPKLKPVTSVHPSVRLRGISTELSNDDVKAMLKKHNFFDRDWNKSGNFKNDFKDNGTVIDRKTGLMWQQSGSDNYMEYKDANDYIRKLNRQGLGGYNDWRLPTIEELVSLLEREKVNGRYIDPVFDKNQRWCWSSDTVKLSPGLAWNVNFNVGKVNLNYLVNVSYVRLVRAGQ
ncbi:DUF1566 domain-containing protein [Desulfococcaceae bacterium HSG9]|nr:DUF1566 domain-containing protein [Desulfococcaceae bacterium HSG9]